MLQTRISRKRYGTELTRPDCLNKENLQNFCSARVDFTLNKLISICNKPNSRNTKKIW